MKIASILFFFILLTLCPIVHAEQVDEIIKVSRALESFANENSLDVDIFGKPKMVCLSYMTRTFIVHKLTRECWLDGTHETIGPDVMGFVVKVQLRDGEYSLQMPMGPNGITSEKNEYFPYWQKNTYAIKLKNGFLLVSISYGQGIKKQFRNQIKEIILSSVK